MVNNNNNNNNYDDDDDNEKHSKIQRNSKAFLKKAIVFMGGLTVVSLGLGHLHTSTNTNHATTRTATEIRYDEPPQQREAVNIKERMEVHAHKKKLLVENLNRQKQVQVQHGQEQLQQLEKGFDEIDLELAKKVDALDENVRARKKTEGVIMETDEIGRKLTTELQKLTLELLRHRYGAGTRHSKFRVVLDLVFPPSLLKPQEGNKGKLVIELAPYRLIPCSVFYFLEIARTYKGGSFHRNAHHVLQAAAQSGATKGYKSMPFQEYSPEHPHAKYTTGYAGRPSGPEWYVSIEDNSQNHGPGSQQKANPHEADSNFGRILEGDEGSFEALTKIHSVPEMGFLKDEWHVKITAMTIMVDTLSGADDWKEWKMPTSML